MEFKYLPKDILSPIFSLVDPEDLVWIGSCGDKEFMERLSREGLVSSVTLTGQLSGLPGGSGSFPFSALSAPAFSSLTRLVIHYETITSSASSWLWDPCFLPSTLKEIDFSFENAFEVFLQPLRDVNNPHWMLQPMYSNRRTPPEQLFTPMLLCDAFPKLEKLRISSGSLFSDKRGFPMHWGVKRPYQDLLHPTLGVLVNWTQAMFWLFLKKLPSSLTILDLSISADTLEKVPELPPNLTSLRYCEGVAPATHTLRFWLKLPESHRPDLSSLPNFQWDCYSSITNTVAADNKFASEIGLFNNIRSLDISKVELQSVADLKLLPRYLTHLKFNFHNTHHRRGTLSVCAVSILPRTITHLTLIEGYWVSDENANNFCSLLPPNLTYLCLEDLNESWNLEIAFSEMRTSLRHLQTLIIDTQHLWLATFDPWLPCDTLHTLKIIANEGNMNVNPGLFSSWPTDIPNNIKSLKFSLSNYGGDDDFYEDEYLQKLPPHLVSLTLDGCFVISPSFFESLPKTVTFLELLSTSFTHQLREKTDDFDCLKDTVIVRHCPKHIIELHMNCIVTGAFLPPNVTKLKIINNGTIKKKKVEVIPRPQQLSNQLRYCNFSHIKLASNCIIPDTLTELDFSEDDIDMALISKIPHIQRLTGRVTAHMDLSTCTSLKSLRMDSLDEYFRPPNGNQIALTSLQELVLQSSWAEEASAYKLSQQFPNITSLKIVDHKNPDGKSHLLFPTVPNNKRKKTDGLDAGSTTLQQLPVLSKLQHLEARGDLIITQSQLKHVTPNLTFLTIGSVSIDNLTDILQSLTPDITKFMMSEIEIIKAICPSITTIGTPPPRILFSGQEVAFPVDCKALLSQLDETLKEEEVEA